MGISIGRVTRRLFSGSAWPPPEVPQQPLQRPTAQPQAPRTFDAARRANPQLDQACANRLAIVNPNRSTAALALPFPGALAGRRGIADFYARITRAFGMPGRSASSRTPGRAPYQRQQAAEDAAATSVAAEPVAAHAGAPRAQASAAHLRQAGRDAGQAPVHQPVNMAVQRWPADWKAIAREFRRHRVNDATIRQCIADYKQCAKQPSRYAGFTEKYAALFDGNLSDPKVRGNFMQMMKALNNALPSKGDR